MFLLTTLYNLMYLKSSCKILLLFCCLIFWSFCTPELWQRGGTWRCCHLICFRSKRNSFFSDSTSFCLTVGGRLKLSRWKRLVKGLATSLFWGGLLACQKTGRIYFFPSFLPHIYNISLLIYSSSWFTSSLEGEWMPVMLLSSQDCG